MPSLRIPKLRPHATGQARATFGGKTVYFGKYGTPRAEDRYHRIVAKWLKNQRADPPDKRNGEARPNPSEATINEVFVGYMHHAIAECADPRSARGNLHRIRQASRALKRLYGSTLAGTFDAEWLPLVREAFIQRAYSRSYIRDLVNIIRDLFRRASTKKLISPETWHGLLAVKHLRAASGRVPEPREVRPVDPDRVRRIWRFLSRQVRATLAIQRVTGARPGEVRIMRMADIDTSRDVWAYRPRHHKTMHSDCKRVILLGPRCQRIIRLFLPRDPEE